MPNAYTGRIITILIVLYVAFAAIFPQAPVSVFQLLLREPISWRHNLRPGIDMVGGTSLIYEIEAVGARSTAGLAEQVATSLKRRVDPQGVMNLVWRPQGDTRLEIQMPLRGDSAEANEIRAHFILAQQRLNDLNVSPAQVVRAIEDATGETRQRQLEILSMGSGARLALFQEVGEAYDELVEARGTGTIVDIAEAQRRYDVLRNRIPATNMTVDEVQAALDATPEVREQRLEELSERNADFPERQEALEKFIEAYEDYVRIRDEIADTATLKRLLRGSGVLAFHILATDAPPQQVDEMTERLRTRGPVFRAGDELRWFAIERDTAEIGGIVRLGPDGRRYALAWVTPELSLDDRSPEWGLARAFPSQDDGGLRAVGFEFDPMGSRLFGDLTGANVGRPLAIILDDNLISAPNINQRIAGSGIITGGRGGFSTTEVAYLVNTLNAGALPARLSDEPIQERTVGPQLGRDNLRAGLVACFFGLIVIFVFLVGYYFTAGLVAYIAVLINVLIILGAMAAQNATFTLPSIAGIILAVGMSVDANILIFERLREEQKRGLSIRMALRNAYDRAFSAIIDANITTGIVAIILYQFGSEEVRGFGLTLLIGIIASLFTALFVTRTIFGLMIDKAGWTDLWSLPLKLPAWDRLLNPNFDWMGRAGYFGLGSAAIAIFGLVLFGMAWARGHVLDIEFAGGTTAQIELVGPMPIDEIRGLVTSTDPEDPLFGAQVVSVESMIGAPAGTTYEVVVTNPRQAEVTNAIVERVGDRLNIREPIRFEGFELTYEQVRNRLVVPITAETEDVDGLALDADRFAAHLGGVAIVLRNLPPDAEQPEIFNRISQQRLGGAYQADGLRGGVVIDVELLPAQNAAIVLLTNDRFLYDPTDAEIADLWERQLAAPAWELVVDAVADPGELSQVISIGPQVAREFQRDATIALILSIVGIMIYIWARFGDLKHGTAAVMALAHDGLFCLAAMGFAHALAGTLFGNLLQLEPFRLNLTMVAAILTVMGFSINDTVVVFDRIRENRGKYGKLTRSVINTAINQTLSRTILTSATTIVTIFVLYVYGGPGIHGFSFLLLIGIVVGTYSSIAIASPLLLLGRQPEEVPPTGTPPGKPAFSGAGGSK